MPLPTLSPAPAAPDPANPGTFNTLAFPFTIWMRDFGGQLNNLITQINGGPLLTSTLETFGGYYHASAGVNIDMATPGDVGLYHDGNAGTWPATPYGVFWWITTQRMYVGQPAFQMAYRHIPSGTPSPTQRSIFYRARSASGEWGQWISLMGEWGSNANGSYARFPNGLQICSRRGSVTITTTPVGGLHRHILPGWTYPAAFSELPDVQFSPFGNSVWGGVGGANLSAVTERISWSASAISGSTLSYSDTAIGRWL